MAGLVEGEPSWDFWGLESLAGLEPKKPNQEVLQLIKYSHHWVLRPPSVRGVEVAKASAAAKARVCIATRWSLNK